MLRETAHYPRAPEDRLAWECHVRRWPHHPAARHHLRHPAVRRLRRWAGATHSLSRHHRRYPPARLLHLDRDARPRSDVPAGALQDPRLHRRQIAAFLSALGRGGLQFMLIIWLQGIWLPLHGYSFEETPLWAGIYMTPVADRLFRHGADQRLSLGPFRRPRLFHSGMIVQAIGFVGADLPARELPLPGLRRAHLHPGLRLGPVRVAQHQLIMSSVPPERRGVASGMRATFQNGASLSVSASSLVL